MNSIEKAYFTVLLEDNFEDETWMKHGSFRGIDFYIRKDGHLLERLNERYKGNITISRVKDLMKNFIKHEIINNEFISKPAPISNPSIPFTVKAKSSNVYISGRFKGNDGKWRCYIATVLPSENTHHSSNDYYKEIDA